MMRSRALALAMICLSLSGFQMGCDRLISHGDLPEVSADSSILILKAIAKASPSPATLPPSITTFSQTDSKSGLKHVEIQPSAAFDSHGPDTVYADLASATNTIAFDMLKNAALTVGEKSPVVLVASENFDEGSAPDEYKLRDAKRLRVELNRAADGRIIFMGTVLASLTTNNSTGNKAPFRLEASLSEVGRFKEPEDQNLCCRKIQVQIVNQESNKTIWDETYLFRDRM